VHATLPTLDWHPADIDPERPLLSRAVRGHHKKDIDLAVVRANTELVFASYPNIGVTGWLLERKTGRIHLLGSANESDAYVWAYYRGFDLSGDTRIRITEVHDLGETIEVLKLGYETRWLRAVLEPALASPPVDLEVPSFTLYCMLRALPACTAFDFEVLR